MEHVKKYLWNTFLSRFLIICFFPVFLLAGCGTETNDSLPFQGTWHVVGLQNDDINVLRIEGQSMCAAMNRDLFCADLSGELRWESVEFEQLLDDEEWVRDFIRFSDSEYLVVKGHASGRGSEYLDQFVPLYYTDNGGGDWEPLENEFTENNAIVNRLEAAPAGDTLYALHGGNIALSKDRGRNWTPFYWSEGRDKWKPHTNSRFLKIFKNNDADIWQGGTSIILKPYLLKQEKTTSEWDHITPYNVDADAWDMVIDSSNPSKIIVGLTGSVSTSNIAIRSLDLGKNWTMSLSNVGVKALANSSLKDQIVYASGKLPSEHLFFTATPDFGDNWETIIYENGPSGIIVNDIATTIIDNSEWLFFATNQGLFGYSFDE